ncbi:MAG: hypothetical protein JO062_28095 [Bryobacterales bacterium]|nr:hypothetical protein [Bryobacterales bacterium]
MGKLDWFVISFVVLLMLFFGNFHWHVRQAHFGLDEMHNLYTYWTPSLWRLVLEQLVFWSKFVRPMGVIYYRPLFALFGLNPVPFTIVRTAILFLNTILFLRLAFQITKSKWIAVLASFPVAYHANLGNLAYDGAFIYDGLCGTFYFSALLYYISCRQGRNTQHSIPNTSLLLPWIRSPLATSQSFWFLILYLCALNTKEMAVSLPIVVLAYELFYRGRKAQMGAILLAVVITAVFIVGKTTGSGTLIELDAYRPAFTWSRFSESTTRFMNTLFYTDVFTMGRVISLWLFLLYIGFRNWGLPKWDPRWLFLFVWVAATPLPIVFLPDRGAATLYLVAGGWAMLVALGARILAHRLAREPVAGLPRRAVMVATLITCIAAYWHETTRADRRVLNWYLTEGSDGEEATRQLRALHIHPSNHARVAFINDPFPKTYHTLFIATLLWADRSVEINLQQIYPLPKPELDAMDYILDYVDGRFVIIRGRL